MTDKTTEWPFSSWMIPLVIQLCSMCVCVWNDNCSNLKTKMMSETRESYHSISLIKQRFKTFFSSFILSRHLWILDAVCTFSVLNTVQALWRSFLGIRMPHKLQILWNLQDCFPNLLNSNVYSLLVSVACRRYNEYMSSFGILSK